MVPQSSPIESFPRPLPDLTIDVRSLLGAPLVASRISSSGGSRIAAVHIARESLECAVLLQTGETFIYRCDSGLGVHSPAKEASDEELLILEHITTSPHRRFRPFLMLAPNNGSISAFALSDIGCLSVDSPLQCQTNSIGPGFVAAGYADGSLFVVDMRTPHIILRHSEGSNSKTTNRHSSKNADPVAAMTWTVATHSTGRSC
jgi:syntaxin-binding protein 5